MYIMPTRCAHDGCNSYPMYNIPGNKGKFCGKHKTSGMINVKNKRCAHEGCDSINPSFDIPGNKGKFCAKHKTSGMIDVRTARCEQEGCNFHPSFGIPGNKGRFCVKHKTSDMIDVKHKRCAHEGCNSRPTFDIEGGTGRFCVTHKTPEMIDVKTKRCAHEGCDSRPNFNIPGNKGIFCVKHKTSDMIDVKNKRCAHEGCNSQPNFNIPGNKGRFCVKHKTSDMIDVNNKRCEHQGCNSQSTFDIIGGKGRFCTTHKTAEMIDVKNKLCEQEGCTTRARYGKPGNPKSHCSPHRKPGMIRRPNAKCANCRELAIWGSSNWVPKHCDTHKTEDEQNLVEQSCISCGLLYILDKNNRCENCNPDSFATTRLAKQNALMSYLDVNGLTGNSTDITIDNGICGKERPDRVYDFDDKIVILECDEHQHRDRQCLCEQTRMVNIGQTFGGLPVYFIRWNPDDYSPANERKIPEEVKKRHKLVRDLIRDIRDDRHILPKQALVSAIYLYYDNWSSLNEAGWEMITKMEI